MSKDLLFSPLSYNLIDLLNIFKLENMWLKEILIKIPIRNLVEDFSKYMFYEELIHEFTRLLRPEDYLKLDQALQPPIDFKYLFKYK